MKDFKDPEVHHRHLSHLFGLFPGHTITFEQTPALFEAAEKSLYKRGSHKLNNYSTYIFILLEFQLEFFFIDFY